MREGPQVEIRFGGCRGELVVCGMVGKEQGRNRGGSNFTVARMDHLHLDFTGLDATCTSDSRRYRK